VVGPRWRGALTAIMANRSPYMTSAIRTNAAAIALRPIWWARMNVPAFRVNQGVLQRPDEGHPDSEGDGPYGCEGRAALGVQPAYPLISLHAGDGGGKRPTQAPGGCCR
jgi:hypothetical protein